MSSNRKAKKRPGGGAGATASRRTPTSTRRTGARPAPARPKGAARGRAGGGKRRSVLADAREYAYRPYVDRAVGGPQDGPAPTRRERRVQERGRRRAMLMTPGAPAVVRGGWPGFLILVFGELVTIPFDTNGILLYWVALVAYAIAGNRGATPSGADTKRAVRDGALAAVFAFALTMPLRVSADIHNANLAPWAILVQVGVALIVGGLAALIASRARRRTGAAQGS